MNKILILVESPNKTKTIKELLKGSPYENAVIMASVGHITEIRDNKNSYYNTGIYPDNGFKADYAVSSSKKDIVEKLKKQVEASDIVYLASDDDREGEAISWSLKKFLKIPENKYKRIKFHEITKKAVLDALANPSKIDDAYVDAAQSRQKLDKMLGYRLSQIAHKEIEAKSVGRCQSAGLKLIVQREEEIKNFKPETYFDLYLLFNKDNTEFKAKYYGTEEKEIKNFKTIDDVKIVVDDCKQGKYNIDSIKTKEKLEYPKPPFTTSTFQQETSSKLNIGVKDAMSCAQKLFEGIEVNGKHIALITYLRTDNPEFAPEFLPILEKYVKSNYGSKYYAPIGKIKKDENAQEGHEALRPVDLDMTPEKLAQYIHDDMLLKVYDIIYKRTIATMMAPAIISETTYTINNGKHLFTLVSRELIFDGFKKIYSYEDNNDDDKPVKVKFSKDEEIKGHLEAFEKQTTPPHKRFKESTFIKELESSGIGRPSTFATIVSTLLDKDRDYCIVKNKEIIPTEKGIELSHFLDNNFPTLININYTSELEKNLDAIAKGKISEITFLKTFYDKLEKSIKDANLTSTKKSTYTDIDEKCPLCGAPMVLRQGKWGNFLGCSKYPKCHGVRKIK
jgi:DNA topoisomerase-1